VQISVVHHAATGHHSVPKVPMLPGALAAEFPLGLAAIAPVACGLEDESGPASQRRATSPRVSRTKTAPGLGRRQSLRSDDH
jgi:hypothetical protein